MAVRVFIFLKKHCRCALDLFDFVVLGLSFLVLSAALVVLLHVQRV
jgi:hypothetical protein